MLLYIMLNIYNILFFYKLYCLINKYQINFFFIALKLKYFIKIITLERSLVLINIFIVKSIKNLN